MQLVPARQDELDAFVALLESAARWMTARGVEQWQPGSFAGQRANLGAAQRRGELLVVRGKDRLLAGAVLASSDHGRVWRDSPPGVGYLSKLVIAGSERGTGFGAHVLAEAERLAQERGVAHLRLDCVADNAALCRYYEAAGYYPRGTADGSGTTVLKLDKRLSPLPGVPVAELPGIDGRHPWNDVLWATLLFVRDGNRVLLIHKKRGHGRGKINGPGGKVETGETPRGCAVRETLEETGVAAWDVEPVAELRFQDSDGSRMLGLAFVAGSWRGGPRETEEARPCWCEVDALPFASMWDDDRIWLPRALSGDHLRGTFLMHQDRLVAHRLEAVERRTLIELADREKR